MKTHSKSSKDTLVGVIAATIASLVFGVTPALIKIAYAGGSNGLTMTFTRGLFALPVLMVIAKVRRFSFRIPRKSIPTTIAVVLFGSFLTTLALYSSYAYISVGMATVLHYTFPVIVMLGGILLFHERVVIGKIIALVFGFAGVSTFFGSPGAQGGLGIVLAASSALFYAIWLLGMDYSILRTLNPFQIAFYSSLAAVVVGFIYGIATHGLNLSMTTEAWFYTLIVSLLISVVGVSLLKLAIDKCGATTTSVICMLEPLSGVFFGWLILGETLTVVNIVGCMLILTSVVLVTVFGAIAKGKSTDGPA
jgi:drug/metabolite transporter (DMT)-like permease